MKVNKAPCGVTHTVTIAKGNITSSEGGDSVKGGILKGTKYAWLCQGPFLKIIDVSSGEKIAGWRFGAACSEFVTEVTCAVELPHCDDASNLKQIVLGLECEVIGGMICIFDVQGSRLLRAIRIPGKPLSLSVVDSGSSGCEGRYPLPGLLSSMSGIIAVGLQGGSVFLSDLCRVSCDELINTWFNDDREEVHDEINPCQLLLINKDDDVSDKLEKKCAAAAVSGDHLCLLLNESAFAQDNFLLSEPGGNVCASFKARNIGVTSLLYVPRIASLIVGYSFGCFQLWNLMHLSLNYTSRLMKDPLPVMHLGFQEPSDDPCNFCYLWAVHSSTDEFPSSSPPVGIMYALSYESKEWVDGYGYLYQDYQSCHFRFEYNLEVESTEEVDSVSCISFNSVSNVASQKSIQEDGCDEGTSENDFSLCIFVWETYDSENKPISTYLSLFDLNQWYKDQMPVRVTDSEDENLGYLVTFSLNCIRQKEVSQIETPLLDIRVDPQNLSQFKSFQPQEEHFHPSALSFVSHCLLEDKIVSLSHPGLQRYLLLYMEKEGPICLLRPLNLFKHCVMVGLKPVLVDINGSSDVPAVTQREFLLSVALENQMLGFLHRCASDWANGSVSGVDCSLPMLLSWGYQRAMVLQQTADSLCIHLFDHTGIRLDKNECRLLDNCASQLRQLATLFEGILNDCRLLNLLNLEDFKQKTNNLNLIALYFEVLLWFLNVGLLPEFPEEFDNETSNDKIPYPASVLTKFYSNRRIEFKNLNLKNDTKASLYIDQLLQNESNGPELANLWISDGGSGMFPPPSIQSLLAMYLLDGIDTQTKNSIVIYVFLDLATLLDPDRYSRTIEYFVKFPCAFYMTPSIIKVTQAFWLLDQKHFEDALDMVLDPLVSPKDLQPWQHRFIVQALLSQGQHTKALEYFTVRQLPVQGIEDIQLKITLLVMNKQVTQAYNFLQQYHNEENNKELLVHFYRECGKAQQLGTVLKLMLSPGEEDLLMNYLQNCNISQSEDMQVVFYLMRSRVIEAVAVNERINFSGIRKIGSRRPRNETVRDMLVGGYAKTLPSVTRQLANYCSQQKKLLSNWRQVQRPSPMSVDVNYGTKQAVSYKSSLIHATLEKARETWMMPVHSPFNSEARKEIMDISAMQNLPFLCTSHDSFRHDRETTPVVFPSVTSSIKRRIDDDGGIASSPLKRSRLENSSPVDNFFPKNKKSVHDHSVSSSGLLKSPLVKRVTPMKQFSASSTQEMNVLRPFAETFTPQSILKVRNLVRSSISPEHSRGHEDDLLSREHSKVKHNEEKVSSRQIRFSLPVSNEVQEQPLASSTPDISEKIKTPKRIVDATSRLPLRSSLSLLQKTVVEVSQKISCDDVSEKKSWRLGSPAKKMVSEKDVYVFGSGNSLIENSNSELDGEVIQMNDRVCMLNESLGEESFYSATSSDSGTSKDSSNVNSCNAESSPLYNRGKYIREIKEIKPRRRLSRVKVSFQDNLSDNGKQKERMKYSPQDAEQSTKFKSNFSHKDSVSEIKMKTQRSKVDNDEDVDSSASEDSEENSNISCVVSKKSILGDTCINISSSSSSTNASASSYNIEESDYSFVNNAPEVRVETPQQSEASSVGKIQQVKGRLPLTRVRKSSNHESSSFIFQTVKSSSLETTKIVEKDVLTDDTKIEIDLETEGKEGPVQVEDDSINISDDKSSVDSVVLDDTDVEIVEEPKGKGSSSCSSVESEALVISDSTDIKSQKTFQEELDVCFSNISRNTTQGCYQQENKCEDFVQKDQDDSGNQENKCEDVGEKDQDDSGKIYASFTTVNTQQSSYQEMLPLPQDVNQGVSVLHNSSEGHGNLSTVILVEHQIDPMGVIYTRTATNVQESDETFVGMENGCTVGNQCVDFAKGIEKRRAEDNTNLMEQDFFTAGDTLATVEDKNVSEKDNLQHSIMSHESKNALKGSYNEDVSKPTKNMEYSYGGTVESDVLDSECIEESVKGQDIGEVDQETCMLKQSSMGNKCESQRESNKNNAYSEAMDWNENADEEDIVLKLSDSENDASQCDREEIEDQSLTTEGHQVLLQTTIKTENRLEKALASDHTTLETEMPVSLAHNVEFEGSTHVDDSHSMSNIPSTDHSVGTKIVNLTAQSQVDKYKNCDYSVESQQLQHSNEVEITSVVGVASSMDGVALPDVTMSENQESKLNSETLEDHYSLRSHQRSRISSVENVPSRMANMLETVHQGKEISQKYSEKTRPRTRRRSLQIESSEGEAETLENKNETVLEESYSSLTVSKSRHRRKSSSVQSEPPLMADVLEDKYQKKEISQPSDNIRSRTRRSSLPVESFGMSDKFASPRKNEVTELEEMSTPNTRRRRKLFSTILNEPTQMADVSEKEHRIKDQDTEVQQTDSGVATDFKKGAHSMDDVNASKTRRQWSKSVQSELLQVTEGSSVKDINECVQEHSEHIVKQRTQSSLQMEPADESKDMIEAVNEISTPRSRLRPQSSSVQREPTQTFEASVKEGETVNQRNLKDPELLKSRRLRNSAQNENCKMDSGLSENKDFEISAGNMTPITRKSCQSNSEAEMPLGKGEQAQKHENEKSFHKEYKSLHDLSLSNTSIAENVPLVVKPTEDPQPSTSFVPVVEEIRMNLRSRRACSEDREIPNTRGKKKNVNSGNSSDSDECSVQSEPPQLCDVTKIKQLRNSKSRRGLSKKKSKKSSYVLRIPAPKLPCVKEEPEMESCVGDNQEISQHSKSENLPTPVRNLRPRKHSESGDSQTSSLGNSRVLRNSHSDDRVDSPVSISSRSTVILDMSHKRKRSSSPSSPERLEVRKFQRVNEDIAEENDAVETTEEIREEGKAQNINPHEIEQYATARRLTRYQKNLMERSMESTKGVRREFHGRQLSSDQSGEESDGESVASGYTTGSSHVRSSARLQEKRQMMDRSPSQSSKASVSGYSPQKRSSRHSSPAHSLEKHGGGSPASVRSGRSTSYASSASSSQWPSPDSAQIQSPLKPRRKSFQNAQHALFSPSTKKHSSLKTPVTTTDTSEAESIGEIYERNFDEKPIQKDETTSETASVKSLASATSSVSRNTRSTAKYETEQSSKIRKSKGRSSYANVHPKKGVRLFKEARLGLSSSSEDSPTKDAKSQEEAAMSAKTQETEKAIEKPARFSVFRKRKYVKLYSKQRKTP